MSRASPKVAVIGAGNVGATAVYYVAEKDLADIVMVDVIEGLPRARPWTSCTPLPCEGTACASWAAPTSPPSPERTW